MESGRSGKSGKSGLDLVPGFGAVGEIYYTYKNLKKSPPRCAVVKSRRLPSKAVRRLFAAFDGF